MQFSTQTSTERVRGTRKQMKALKSLPLMAVLSLFLLFAQAVEHGHSHKADLQAQIDCEICFQIGSLEDVAIADAANLRFPSTQQTFSILFQNKTSFEPVSASARGPPSYT